MSNAATKSYAMRPVQSVTNRNTPRSIRARLAAPRRRSEAGQHAQLPESPTQQVALSASGKMALG